MQVICSQAPQSRSQQTRPVLTFVTASRVSVHVCRLRQATAQEPVDVDVLPAVPKRLSEAIEDVCVRVRASADICLLRCGFRPFVARLRLKTGSNV